MLNTEKVRHMTKAAAYENGAENKNLKISSYFRSDYIGLQLIKSGFAYTVSFVLLLVMWGMGKVDELMLMINRPEYTENLIKSVVLLFVSMLCLYEIAVYVYYSAKYEKAKKSVKEYNGQLRSIQKFYEKQDDLDIVLSLDEEIDEESTL